jgi:hypothetical protein
MAETTPQSFERHVRIVPAYHMGALGIFLLNLLWSIYRLVKAPNVESAVALLLAFAFLIIFFYARVFALTVQDRVIRLEMQMRMRQLLPADLHGRIEEFTPKQLVALRFASDEELPALCRPVINDKVTDQKSIKKMIKKWRPDHLRA